MIDSFTHWDARRHSQLSEQSDASVGWALHLGWRSIETNVHVLICSRFGPVFKAINK